MRRWQQFLLVCLGVGFVAVAMAQSYPAKPVRIVTVAPGSANDIVARLIANELRPVRNTPLRINGDSHTALP